MSGPPNTCDDSLSFYNAERRAARKESREALVKRVIKALETQVLFMDEKHARLAAEAAIAAVRQPRIEEQRR